MHSIVRLSWVSLAFGAFLGIAATAQTAPQLLPYALTAVAGGGTAAISSGAVCPASGLTSTDAYGDGCLATEVQLGVPRFVTTDKNGIIYFSDTNNGLIRTIDPSTGVISTVVGGAASSPGSGTTCGVGVSTDAHGDGCPAPLVKLGKPEGLIFAPNGDLYFSDNSFDDVRKVTAIGGLITANSIITNVVGNISTYGYKVNNTSTTGPVIAATQSYLNFPYGVALDAAGNLYVADEGNQAIEVVNLQATTQTIQGLSVPAGTIAKIAGYGSASANATSPKSTTIDCPSFTSTSDRGGCYFGAWTDGNPGVSSGIDNPFDIAFDPAGNLYFANEFNYNAGRITASNVISNYAGKQASKGSTITTRATAGTFGIGNTFNVAVDANANVYVSDGSNGVVWRVDAPTKSMYVIAGGASTVCGTATNTVGDGCPATQAIFPKSGGSGATLLPGTGGLSVDPFGSLYITDTTDNTIRKASSGTQFGPVGASPITQTVVVHFAAGDTPAANAYTITSGSANFSAGSASCNATNSDGTVDCLLPVTATGSTLGAFSGTLQVKSTLGATGTFPLGGIYVQSPQTRTTLTATNPSSSCSGSTTYSTTAALTLTATVISTGSPAGTVTFFDGTTQIGTPQSVSSGKATLTFTFANAGSHNLKAVYSGDTYFKTSTSPVVTIATSAPTFTAAAVSYQENAVTAGGSALYSFTINQSVYSGAISFACSGLPANSSCVFSPTTITGTGCSTTNTVALTIFTQAPAVRQAGFAGGRWPLLTSLTALALACALGLRRRRLTALGFGQIGMMLALLLAASGLAACGKSATGSGGTPVGSSTVTVSVTGSAGTVSSFTVPLTVK